MRARFFPLLLAALALPASQLIYPGCATLIGGVTQEVKVKTKPAGARVFVNGKFIGTAPARAVVSRWGFHRVRIEMKGFKPWEAPLEKRFNDEVFGNIFIGGAPIVIDALTGAIFRLEPPVNARVEKPIGSNYSFDSQTFYLVVAMQRAPVEAAGARKIGQLERR